MRWARELEPKNWPRAQTSSLIDCSERVPDIEDAVPPVFATTYERQPSEYVGLQPLRVLLGHVRIPRERNREIQNGKLQQSVGLQYRSCLFVIPHQIWAFELLSRVL